MRRLLYRALLLVVLIPAGALIIVGMAAGAVWEHLSLGWHFGMRSSEAINRLIDRTEER